MYDHPFTISGQFKLNPLCYAGDVGNREFNQRHLSIFFGISGLTVTSAKHNQQTASAASLLSEYHHCDQYVSLKRLFDLAKLRLWKMT